jgi:3-hydroxyacyl-[acyl-carrier-protein] dehydratase
MTTESGAKRLEAPAGRAEIEAAIPHRDPFLLVSEVLEVDEHSIVTRWTVPADADWTRGHYPGQPITPGVLLCEHAVQSGALLVSRNLAGFDAADGVPVLTKLQDARFRQMVLPGQTVETRVEVTDRVGPAWILKARVTLDGKRAVDLACTLSAAGAMARTS